MKIDVSVLALVLALAVFGRFAWGQPLQRTAPSAQTESEFEEPVIGSEGLTANDREEIESLIRELVNIQDPDIGFSPTMTGSSFAPIPSTQKMLGGILMNHGLKRSRALTKLVAIGPKALPYLLRSIEDKTPTLLTINHSGSFGSMWHDGDEDFGGNRIENYTLRVGDLCYVIIGQITNCTYEAVRYQPTACIVIRSPLRNKRIVDEVRQSWTATDPAQKLWETLNNDLDSEHFRAGAIIRLGYYYPEESEAKLVDLISKIDYSNANSADYSEVEIVEALATSRNEEILGWVSDIMRMTPNEDFFAATLAAFDATFDKEVLQRCKQLLRSLPDETDQGEEILQIVDQRFPSEAEAIFKEFVDSQSVQRRATICDVLWYGHKLAPKILMPLLDDQREIPGFVISTRVCDRAAEAISNFERKCRFNNLATSAKRDEQIEKIKLQCLGISVGRLNSRASGAKN